MSIPVSVQDVVGQMEMLDDEVTAYLNRKTGELVTVTEEERDTLEADPESFTDWEREGLSQLREIDETEDYIELPTSFDIHEYSIMEPFCQGSRTTSKECTCSTRSAAQGPFAASKTQSTNSGSGTIGITIAAKRWSASLSTGSRITGCHTSDRAWKRKGAGSQMSMTSKDTAYRHPARLPVSAAWARTDETKSDPSGRFSR